MQRIDYPELFQIDGPNSIVARIDSMEGYDEPFLNAGSYRLLRACFINRFGLKLETSAGDGGFVELLACARSDSSC